MTMQYLCQLFLTVLAVWHACYGSPVPIISDADRTQQNDVVNTFMNYLTTNTNISLTLNLDDDIRGYCPWKYVSNHDINRYPVSIMYAELTMDDNRCLGVTGTYGMDYFCEYIYKTAYVQGKKCTFCPYQKKQINVRVGARCVPHPTDG